MVIVKTVMEVLFHSPQPTWQTWYKPVHPRIPENELKYITWPHPKNI